MVDVLHALGVDARQRQDVHARQREDVHAQHRQDVHAQHRPDVAVLFDPDAESLESVGQLLARFSTVVLTRDAVAATTILAQLDPIRPDPDAGLRVDERGREVSWQGVALPLTRIERALLQALLEPPRRLWTYRELHERVWGGAYLGDPAIVHCAVKRLRRKLAVARVRPRVDTVRGVGFRLDAATATPSTAGA